MFKPIVKKNDEKRKRVLRNKHQGRKVQSVHAKMLNGKSVGTIEGQDISHAIFSGESKHRKAFVGQTFMNQAIKNCPVGKIPITIVHILRQNHENDLVMIQMKDFLEMIRRAYGDKPNKDN